MKTFHVPVLHVGTYDLSPSLDVIGAIVFFLAWYHEDLRYIIRREAQE